MAHIRAPFLSSPVLTVATVLIGGIIACGSQTVTSLYTVGGNVTGLIGTVKLANNGGDTLTVTAAGAFTFATKLKAEAPYDVTVAEAPAGQVCTVSDGQGTIGTANVSRVVVTCSTGAFTLGGTVSGLTGSLVLGNSSAVVSVASGASTFVFADALANGAPYNVTVKTQPAGQRCDIAGGSGTVSGANVTSVAVTCASTHAIKVHVTGMTGVNMEVANGNDILDVAFDSANSSHTYDKTFATGLVAGDAYAVTVVVQPQDQDTGNQSNYCTPQSPNGTVTSGDVTVNISCVQALTLRTRVARDGISTTVELSDGISPDITYSDSSADQLFAESYPDGASYHVHLVTGTGCVPCATAAQTASGGDVSGSFSGSDVYVYYKCDNVACPTVN